MPQMKQGICKAVEDDLQILHKQHSAQLKQLFRFCRPRALLQLQAHLFY